MSPYSKKRYETKAKYRKYKRCVEKVRKKDKKVKSPEAICRKSVYKTVKKKKKE